MTKKDSNKLFLEKISKGFRAEMPRILKEIKVYEKHLKNGTLNTSFIPAPQFNS